MKTLTTLKEKTSEMYIAVIIGILGVFAFISAVLIAWPALAYLGAKLFN